MTRNALKFYFIIFSVSAVICVSPAFSQTKKGADQQEIIRTILRVTDPLKFPRGDRLPLYVSSVRGLGTPDPGEAETLIRLLNDRGIAVFSRWNTSKREEALEETLMIGRIQKKLGLLVNADATPTMHRFFNGDEATFHISKNGERFYDSSFSEKIKMGCPFALKSRYPEIKEQIEFFLKAYKREVINIDMIYLDWEIDGPIEWNDAWANSKKCKRCRENIGNMDDFREFQRALRAIRCEIQREVFADTVKSYFPEALVSNYAAYPNDGYRYWYDWFEKLPEGAPYLREGNAKYREWFQEFPLTGYTFAMPVVYTWHQIFSYYDFSNTDYRWFYNMLKVASNAGQNTPSGIPVISFAHWTTTAHPGVELPADLVPMSEKAYRELLWHMLLRGHDTFFMWCRAEQVEAEIKPVHQVYAESLEYKEFLDKGEPVTFDVPPRPGPVVSGLKLGDKVLVRRTDFDETKAPVIVRAGNRQIKVEPREGQCVVLRLE